VATQPCVCFPRKDKSLSWEARNTLNPIIYLLGVAFRKFCDSQPRKEIKLLFFTYKGYFMDFKGQGTYKSILFPSWPSNWVKFPSWEKLLSLLCILPLQPSNLLCWVPNSIISSFLVCLLFFPYVTLSYYLGSLSYSLIRTRYPFPSLFYITLSYKSLPSTLIWRWVFLHYFISFIVYASLFESISIGKHHHWFPRTNVKWFHHVNNVVFLTNFYCSSLSLSLSL